MLDILQNFEQASARFAPLVLIVPGLAAIAVGLFVWLCGLRFRRLLVSLLGAIGGAVCGFLLTGRNIVAAMVAAGVAALAAIIFARLLITILLAALVAILAFAVLLGPCIKAAEPVNPPDQGQTANQGSTFTIRQSIEILKAYAVDFSNKVKHACSQMPVYSWAIIAVLAVISIVAGFWLWRLASALCCAALGALLIFAGMILLLSYKGSAPITKIADKTSFYGTVFIAMTAFGTVEQLLLCRCAERRSSRKKQAIEDKQESEQTTRSWRTT